MNADDLIQGFLDGQLSADDATKLSRLLESDASVRARYLDLAGLHAALMADETLRVPLPIPQATRRRLPSWVREVMQMAAGVVLGAVAVSAVWAYAAPRATGHELPLVDGGFENVPIIAQKGVPNRVGSWSGDPMEIIAARGAVKARSGLGMVRFLTASTTGDYAGSTNMASDLWQVIELPGSGSRTVKVRAWFNAESDKRARFHLAAVATEGNAASAPELWAQRSQEGTALAFARAMTFVDDDPATWEVGELTLQVPPQARVLVIGIAAYRLPVVPASEWFPAQFVDDVSVSFTEEVLP